MRSETTIPNARSHETMPRSVAPSVASASASPWRRPFGRHRLLPLPLIRQVRVTSTSGCESVAPWDLALSSGALRLRVAPSW